MIPYGSLVVYVTPNKDRRYIKRLEEGQDWHSNDGVLSAEAVHAANFGSEVRTSLDIPIRVLEATLHDRLKGLKRQTQIISPKDIAYICLRLGAGPGRTIIEAGCGSGGLTTGLSWFCGPTGRVVSHEAREEFMKLARRNLEWAGVGDNVEIVGILNGYSGLINGDYKEMCEDDFRGILTLGGTILGTKRTPFKMMRVVEDDNIDKVAAMKKTYKEAKLDCLLCLGGNGTHKTANLLSQEGLNIIGLPKTIDNDIYGTDVTFGFHTAVDIATDVIDRIHTTAGSHSRVMCIEIMGNKAGWLTLYSGIAGGADIILLPEQPYDIDRVCSAVERRAKKGSNFSIIAVAEGAINCEEAGMKRKEWMAKRAEAGFGTTATNRIAQAVQKKTGMETRVCIPGHMQRGGSPSAYDRVLATQFGSYAAKLVEIERYGVTVAMVNRHVTENRLADIAGKTRNVPENCDLLTVARRMGISLG